MKILVIDNGTKHLGKLKELLSGNELKVESYFKIHDAKNFDLIILSGGSQVSITTAPELFKEEINLLESSDTPIIGICEGCEIIAYAYSSYLEPFTPKAHGKRRIELIDPKFINLDSPIEVYEAHHLAITKLGKDLESLAKSNTGYEIIKHKTKKIWGLQFHPEMLTNSTLGKEIFFKILEILNLG